MCGLFGRALGYPVTPHLCLHLWHLPGHDCLKNNLLENKKKWIVLKQRVKPIHTAAAPTPIHRGTELEKHFSQSSSQIPCAPVWGVAVGARVGGQTLCWCWLTYIYMTSTGSTGLINTLDTHLHEWGVVCSENPKDECQKTLEELRDDGVL